MGLSVGFLAHLCVLHHAVRPTSRVYTLLCEQGLFEDAQTKAFEDSIKKNYTGKSNGDGYCSATACGFRPSSNFKVVIPKITIKNDTPGGF